MYIRCAAWLSCISPLFGHKEKAKKKTLKINGNKSVNEGAFLQSRSDHKRIDPVPGTTMYCFGFVLRRFTEVRGSEHADEALRC